MKKITTVFLLLIIIFAAILRLWQIGTVPLSPDWDEVALGYNAYSLLHTGHDEYGTFLPVVLRSFNDYKPAMYAYLAIPSIAILGLNVIAVRLPSVIFGLLAIVATCYLVRELFKKDSLALLTAFLLAISPWHIQFSRVAFETNIGDAFNIFAALFFIKGLKKPWLLLVSAVFVALSIYTYQSEKVFTPLLILLLIAIYWKDLWRIQKKYLVSAGIIGLLFILPMIIFIISNNHALSRAQATLVFSDPAILQSSAKSIAIDEQQHDKLGPLLDNRRFVFAKAVVAGYLSHFNLNWLFISGDIARHHAPEMGLLYIWELPFLLLGMYFLWAGNYDKRTKMIVFLWLLIAPIPASVTSGVPHAVRTMNFLPTFQIFIAIGLFTVSQKVMNSKYPMVGKNMRYVIVSFFCMVFLFNFVYFLDQYFVQTNYFYAKDWIYGYAQAVPQIKDLSGNYKKVVVENDKSFDQSYMFLLFYLKYPPDVYQKEYLSHPGKNDFGRFIFQQASDMNFKEKNVLFFVSPDQVPSSKSLLKVISYPDGKPAMAIVGT